jgi:hypothetical protein
LRLPGEASGAFNFFGTEDDLMFLTEKQIAEEGFTAELDKGQYQNQLSQLAACYAIPENLRQHLNEKHGYAFSFLIPYGWPGRWFKPVLNNRIRELEKAGALIAAEIDRLQRLENKKGNSNG